MQKGFIQLGKPWYELFVLGCVSRKPALQSVPSLIPGS